MKRFPKHIPCHVYLDDQIYFITARTIKAKRFFNNEEKIRILSNKIILTVEKFNLKLFAWSVLMNHYHLLFLLKNGNKLPAIIRSINGGASYDLNKFENMPGRQIWWNYWDYCIRDEDDFYKHFNYIHSNPIKHGLVKNHEELKDYEFSSFKDYYKEYGTEKLMDFF
ncbi:MAG: hypothetical protein GF365_01595 [Candidatus Buchananbacteria bacterium]|nr:hypothetical protein [Candidatus Buchananbacteria bacterium]